jgi:hypothetical protein
MSEQNLPTENSLTLIRLPVSSQLVGGGVGGGEGGGGDGGGGLGGGVGGLGGSRPQMQCRLMSSSQETVDAIFVLKVYTPFKFGLYEHPLTMALLCLYCIVQPRCDALISHSSFVKWVMQSPSGLVECG